MKPIALIIPWYGDDIRGGAETECNTLAHILQASGCEVEVFTTCVKDASCDRGKNTLTEGVCRESGILVHRFPVKKQNKERFQQANHRIYHNRSFTPEDEESYFAEDINSPAMYEYIKANKEKYRCFIFIPYMYGITYHGSESCMEKAIMIPCLHDESYAYMEILKSKMPRFKGLIFHARPESELAQKLYPLQPSTHAVLGEGVDTSWHDRCKPERFREKFGIHDKFIVFAGRKDKGKKVDELIEFFSRYKRNEPAVPGLKLVLMGADQLPVPGDMQTEIIDLGFVSTEDKHDAFAAAEFLCNPSWFESFSLILMESWIAKRPALVSEHCAVTASFCQEANAGLYYRNYTEFAACIDYLLTEEETARKMGENGWNYVASNFSYSRIAERYLAFIEAVGL